MLRERKGAGVKLECPNCNSRVISPQGQNGESVCSECGLVLSKTSIVREQAFFQWNPEWHSNWHENDSETLKEWLTILRTVCCQLNLPNFPYREEAARRIRKENHLFFKSQKFGKNKRATVAALIYQILRQYEKNRSIKQICSQLTLDSRLVAKQSWSLNKVVTETQTNVISISRKTSTDYLFDYGGKIINNNALLVEAKQILMKIRRTGGNPVALASGALYHVCKERKFKVSKEQIGEAFRISRRTVYTNEARIRTLLQRLCIQKQQTPISRLPLLTVENKNR